MPPLRRRMGWRRVSQSLNSPVTVAHSAFGAQTAKRTPRTPSPVARPRAVGQVSLMERAFGVQVEIGIGDERAEAVGVLHLDAPAIPQQRSNQVALRAAFERGAEKALLVLFGHGVRLLADQHVGRFGLRQERAHFPAALRLLFPDAVRPQNAKRVAVVAADYGIDIFAGHGVELSAFSYRLSACVLKISSILAISMDDFL